MVPALLLSGAIATEVVATASLRMADGFEKRVGPFLRRTMLTYRPGDDRRHVPRPEAFPAE